MKKFLIITIMSTIGLQSQAKDIPKGVMPELRIDGTNEDANQRKALQSEVLISKSEKKALDSLLSIVKRRKGSPDEPDLLNRLAELYMRRAKTGRFFDLNRENNEAVTFAPAEVTNQTAANNLREAIKIYTRIDSEFPKFREMDSVLYNAAFASQQLRQTKQAEQFYLKMVQNGAKSPLFPDAHLALGELKYQAQNFQGALEHFLLIQKFPNSRVYSYGMYKTAWTLYNLHQTDKAISKLIEVVKYYNPSKSAAQKQSYNLRGEAIRDLTIFFEETSTPDKAYAFFSSITTEDELGDAMIQLGKIYDAHSRHKEMNAFLSDFINKVPGSAQRIKAHLLLVQANEALKARPEVIKQLKTVDEICRKDSGWASVNPKIYDESCNFDFAKTNVEIAKKWWDIWLKNKQHKEIADLTRQAFKIHLDREDPKTPDSKSRYAYAELLYQLEDFRTASEQYVIVGDRTLDTTLKNDSDYSALVAFEKASAKKKEVGDDEKILVLSERYLTRNPKGEHAMQVGFKIGFVYYETKKFDQAEKWLKPLASNEKAGEFKRKSEDLVLDILNARKDFKGIKDFSKIILSQTKDEARKVSLTKILQEADYTEIQESAKTGDKVAAAQKLTAFSKEHGNSPLAKESLWQAMSLYYAAGRGLDGADLAKEYVKTYSNDPKALDALKDAATAYSDSGQIILAAQTMELVAAKSAKDFDKYTEAAAELYALDGNKKLAVATLTKLLGNKDSQNQGKIYSKILATMKGQESSAEYQKIEAKIASLGVEPYASDIKFRRVQNLFDSKQYSDAFNAAKNLVGSDKISDEVRAKARILQARVLEDEFIKQSTKTSIEKLSVILSLKTEKLDKAQTAYLSAAKISTNPNIQLEALQGLNRIYKNYTETVGHPTIKNDLNAEDKKALQAELSKLTKPIADKMDDTGKKLQALAKESKAMGGTEEVDFTNLPGEESVKARIRNPTPEKLMPYLPQITDKNVTAEKNYSRFIASKADNKTEKCVLSEKDKSLETSALIARANLCISQGNFELTEKIAIQVVRNDPQSPLGTYYMSVMADQKGLLDKALWLIDLSLKKVPDMNFINYQKARILYAMKDYSAANKLFIKAHDFKLVAAEAYLMHGALSFAEGDCFTVTEDFGKLDSKTLNNYNLGPALAECHAQKGDMEKGFAVIKNQLQLNPGNVDLLIQAAYMSEIYKSDAKATIQAYENVAKAASQPEIKDWVQRKLNYLKGTPSAVTMLEK